ncbi:MAG: hypothetical protein Q8S50_08440 [Methylotenera sp.]|nr:DUF6876 family protein [Methylotenera sp.]MDP3308277.1 hypothetical protein [Methylotenera sp.]
MQFSGTEHYYAHNFGGMTYTDGVKYFADKVGAYWFLDIVSTELMLPADKEGFISIHLVSADSKAVAKADDGNYNVFWTRKIEYTDCPAGDWQFYLTNRVLMLPSEY